MKKSLKNIRLCLVGTFRPWIGGIPLLLENLTKNLEREGVKVYPVSKSTHPLIQPFKVVYGLLKSVPKCDIVHVLACSYWGFMPTIPSIIIGNLFKKKVVVTYHGGGAPIFLKKWGFLAKPFLNQADSLVVTSEFIKKTFTEHGFKPLLIPDVHDMSRFKFKERRSVKPNILFSRHLEKDYNPACAIRSFKIIKDRYPAARLELAGSGSQEDELRVLVEEIGLKDVVFLGRIRYEDMPEVYQRNGILVNPTNVDNVSPAVLEAFASGMPVVSTNPCDSIHPLIEDGVSGLIFDLDDSIGLSEKVFHLLEDQEYALDVSQNARKVIEKYSWNSVKPLYESIYLD